MANVSPKYTWEPEFAVMHSRPPITNGVNQDQVNYPIQGFFLSKQHNKTEELSNYLLIFLFPGLSEANAEDKPYSCAIPTHELCCFGPVQVSFIFIGF